MSTPNWAEIATAVATAVGAIGALATALRPSENPQIDADWSAPREGEPALRLRIFIQPPTSGSILVEEVRPPRGWKVSRVNALQKYGRLGYGGATGFADPAWRRAFAPQMTVSMLDHRDASVPEFGVWVLPSPAGRRRAHLCVFTVRMRMTSSWISRRRIRIAIRTPSAAMATANKQ